MNLSRSTRLELGKFHTSATGKSQLWGKVEDYQTSKKDFKNFKDNLVYFWDTLVAECENGPLFEPDSAPVIPYFVLSLFQGGFFDTQKLEDLHQRNRLEKHKIPRNTYIKSLKNLCDFLFGSRRNPVKLACGQVIVLQSVASVAARKEGEVEDYQTSKKDFMNFKDNLVYFWVTLVAECENGPLFEPDSAPIFPYLVLSLLRL
uniref:Stromal antigen n=1 Tax=Solanum tuberosum TaxID=4113 RepID=M1A3F4_SOLTU